MWAARMLPKSCAPVLLPYKEIMGLCCWLIPWPCGSPRSSRSSFQILTWEWVRKGFIYLRLFICIGSEVHKKHIHAKKCLLLVFMNDMGILPFVTAYLGKLNVKGILFLRVYLWAQLSNVAINAKKSHYYALPQTLLIVIEKDPPEEHLKIVRQISPNLRFILVQFHSI